MEDLSRTVRGLSVSLRQAVDGLLPDEVEVEFGLELALKSGKLIEQLAGRSRRHGQRQGHSWVEG